MFSGCQWWRLCVISRSLSQRNVELQQHALRNIPLGCNIDCRYVLMFYLPLVIISSSFFANHLCFWDSALSIKLCNIFLFLPSILWCWLRYIRAIRRGINSQPLSVLCRTSHRGLSWSNHWTSSFEKFWTETSRATTLVDSFGGLRWVHHFCPRLQYDEHGGSATHRGGKWGPSRPTISWHRHIVLSNNTLHHTLPKIWIKCTNENFV